MIPIQANATGFGGRASSLFSAYDGAAMVLAISVSANEFRPERFKDSVLITNVVASERDSLFTERDIKEAINAYYSLKNGVAADGESPRLTFGDRAANADPASSIERDGVDTNGFKYRISESISNAQIATLMTCWYVIKIAGLADDVFSMADKLMGIQDRLSSGEVLTF